jgi:hypothetical protein
MLAQTGHVFDFVAGAIEQINWLLDDLIGW